MPKTSTSVSPEDLVKEFRAYLHLAITTRQMGQSERLKTLPGPRICDYCRELAKLPGNTLAGELVSPIWAMLEQIEVVTRYYQAVLRRNEEKMMAMHEEARLILKQLDFALGLMLRRARSQVSFRAAVTQDADLLCEWTHQVTSCGPEAERLVRRYQKLFPIEPTTDGFVDDGGFADSFAWDVYQRVAALDRLADEFPDLIRLAARRMHAWPMLTHRHTNNRRRFTEVARSLELGTEYPTDVSEGARWRPDTPWVRYLDPLVHRLHSFCYETEICEAETPEKERNMVNSFWWQWPEATPGDEVVKIVCAARRLHPLTKATASQWAEKALVPLILATDASDWKNCKEPALQQIAKQKGVKSRATFKSRLLSAVIATLRRLARPA